MSEKASLTVKIDKTLKLEAQETAQELGIPLSTAVNALLRQFTQNGEITISTTLKPSPYLEKILKQSEEEYARGEYYGPFDTVEEMIDNLNSLSQVGDEDEG